jgi:hypothetical protein
MKTKSIVSSLAVMVVFAAVALTLFTENVRTVQILGLFFCGMAVGAAFTRLIMVAKTKQA